MSSSHVLVLGGAGAVGHHTARRLLQLGHAVTIAGRTATTLEQATRRIPGIEAIVGDAADHDTLRRAGPVEAVVNTTGLASADIIQPWLDAGVHVVDIAASGEEMRRLELVHADHATLLLSVGLLPGLSTLMATHLADADRGAASITIGALLGVGEDYGDASRRWTISRLGQTVDGPAGAFRNFVPSVAVDYPAGFGRRRAHQFDFADQLVLTRDLGILVTTVYCLDSRFATAGLTVAARIPGAPKALLAANRISRRATRGSDWWAATAHTNSLTLWALGRAQSHGTAMITALATDLLLSAPPRAGVRHLHQLVSLDDIRDQLPAMGIAVAKSCAPPRQ